MEGSVAHRCLPPPRRRPPPPPLKPPADLHPQMQRSRWEAFQALADSLCAPAESGHKLVIADDTFHYRSMRREAFRLSRDSGAAFLQLHVACPLDLALQRNSQRAQEARVPEEVVTRMDAVFEAPASRCADWDGSSAIHVDASAEVEAGDVWGEVWSAWGAAPLAQPDEQQLAEERSEARAATAESALHRADLVCRQMLAETLEQLAELPPPEKAAAARRLNSARKECLAAMRRSNGDGGEEHDAVAALRQQCEAEAGANSAGLAAPVLEHS